MLRRRVLLLIASTFAGASLPGLAQKAGIRTIALFHVGLDHVPPSLEGLREGLKQLGYVEGRDIRLDWRNLPDESAAAAAAQAFVRNKVDLIVAFEGQCADAAFKATKDIPVIILHVADPVASGFVKSLAHPGGNVTGLVASGDTADKELEIFKELMPGLKAPLVLYDPDDPTAQRWMSDLRRVAPGLKLQLVERRVSTATDVEQVFGALKPGQVDGVFLGAQRIRVKFHSLVLELASRRRLPVAGHRAEWVERGALFSYNIDIRSVGLIAASRYVDKILKGIKPADLPVEQDAKYILAVNAKVARNYGIAIPNSIRVRAEKVFE